MDRTLVVASNNKNKIREIKQILGDIFDPVSLSEAGVVSDPEETGKTFLENAIIKAKAACEASGKPSIADDSGLCVFALNGAPGVYSARYACAEGEHENASDEKNNEKLIRKMEGTDDRRAVFRSAVAIVWPDGKTVTAEGECPGVITHDPRGNNGFGYDPYFLVEEYGKTFAELDGSVKNIISHRAHALAQLKNKLAQLIQTEGNI
jgi:XTP/dITP diphosphohydrolase